MRIDIATGNLTLLGLMFSYKTTLEDANQYCSTLNLSTKIKNMQNDWKWLRIDETFDEGFYVALSLAFNKRKLSIITFNVSDKKGSQSGWEDWSEQEERGKVVFMNNWLSQQVGGNRKYNWGEIWCEYDPKGASASAGICYF